MRLRVPGHRLQGRGAPHTGQTCQKWPCDLHAGVRRVDKFGTVRDQGVGGHGHALCECGWTSEHLLTGAARRRAWRRHKRAQRELADLAA